MAIGEWQTADIEQVHLSTGDRDHATELFRRSFPGIDLSSTDDGPGFAFAFDRVGDGRMTVNRLRLSASAIGVGSIGDGVGVARLLGGRFALEYGRDEIDTALPYLRPPGRSSARLRDAHVQLIELDPQAFAAAAYQRLEGTGRTVHRASADAAGPADRRLVRAWQQIADLVMSVALDEAAFASPLVRAGLYDLVVTGMLATFAVTSETGVAGRHGAGPAAIRRAVAYIDEHLGDPIDVAAIAGAARLPVRSLQAAFRAQLGVAPMEHVRRRRLAAAREELTAAEAGAGTTVAAVAHRWGFAHMARFAEQYRRTYGENPSDTLRQ